MNVVQLGPYPPPNGGVQTNLVAIRRRLREGGHHCAVINLHRFRTSADDDVYHPTNALAVVSLLLELKADIIHLHIGGSVTKRLLGLALACTMRPGTRSVLTLHSGGYPGSKAGRRARRFGAAGLVLRRFDRVIVVNGELEALCRRLGVSRDRTRLIRPHPVPVLAPETQMPQAIRDFFAAHMPVLIGVCLLEPEYNLTSQIEALGMVRERHPEAGLALIGSGSLETELRRQIDTVPYSRHVLLCGDVRHDATLRAIEQASALLRTTAYDGDSVAVREALHLGTPVIATDNGMRPPGVRLIPRLDVGALASAIEATLSEGRPKTTAEPEDHDNMDRVLAVYGELTGHGRPVTEAVKRT